MDTSIRIDMRYFLDLSEFDLGISEWDFGASKPEEVAPVEARVI
ncbi:MAG: hypothetical protein ABL891_03950 [Burkholderiales bacterium]